MDLLIACNQRSFGTDDEVAHIESTKNQLKPGVLLKALDEIKMDDSKIFEQKQVYRAC